MDFKNILSVALIVVVAIILLFLIIAWLSPGVAAI